MQGADSMEKTLMLGKIESKRRRCRHRMRWLDSIANSVDMNLSKLWETVEGRGPGMLQSMGSQRVGHNLVTEQLLWVPLTHLRSFKNLKADTILFQCPLPSLEYLFFFSWKSFQVIFNILIFVRAPSGFFFFLLFRACLLMLPHDYPLVKHTHTMHACTHTYITWS